MRKMKRSKRYVVPAAFAPILALALGWTAPAESPPASTHGEGDAAGGGERRDAVVAIVNGEPIYMSELLRELAAAHGEEAMERILARTLVLQEARAAGVTVTEAEIDAQMVLDEQRLRAELTSAFRDVSGTLKGDKATLEDIVRARFNMSLEKYRNEVVRERLLVRKCVLKGVEPTQAQLREFFASYRRLYDVPAQYRASHILVSPFGPDDWRRSYSMKQVRPSEAEWDKALAKAKELKARLDRGESFEDIVREHSMDRRENVAAGGDVGWFTHPGRMDPAFSKEAARMKVGEVGGPVKTDYGYHLVKLTDFRPGKEAVYEEVADRVRRDYLENLVQLRTEGWLAASRAGARIEKFRKAMWPAAGTDDPVVATVNGEAVRRSALFDELIMGEGPEALDRLVNARLMKSAARARKIVVQEFDVDIEINKDRMALEKAAPGTPFEQYIMETYGLDSAGYRRSVRERLEIRKLLLDSLRYDDGDLRAFFAINAERYSLPERYVLSRIIVRPVGKGEDPVPPEDKVSPEQWMAARRRAEAVAGEARGGAKFETLVVRYSDDRPEIVRRFGSMTGISEKDMHPAVAEALAKMSPGGISEPIRTPEGFQIVRLERKIPPRRFEFEEARDLVERDYLAEQMALKGDLMLRELRERAQIEYLMDLAPRRARPAGRGN